MLVLVTNPEIDQLTRYLRVWTKKLIKHFNKKHDFIHLEQSKVSQKRFRKTLEKKGVECVLLNGHGADDRIAGNSLDDILLDTSSAHLLKGTTVHALSCSTAQTLGPEAIRQGAKAYVGYDKQFVIVLKNDHLSNPLQDDTAALFLDPAMAVPKALLDGKSAAEAVAQAKQAYNNSIIKAFSSDIQSDNDQFIKLLLWDRNHLKSC